MKTLVLVRHGQSTWNEQGLFTGWMDPGLTERGKRDARAAGRLLRDNGITFRVAYTSVLRRAIDTLHLIEDEMGLSWIENFKDWRLNEKHYGILQGWSKKETAREFGEEQVQLWRRSYDCAPPPLAQGDERCPESDVRYEYVKTSLLPHTESLRDTVERVRHCWEMTLKPILRRRDTLLISAHGNSLRALLMVIKNLTPEEVSHLNIPTAIPLLVRMGEDLAYVNDQYLGEPEMLRRGVEEAASV